MRLKQFMFAFVAMLSFTFSALAQTTVTTEAELKTAMSSGGAVVLGADIELNGAAVIPKKIAVVLDLNGHKIEGVTTGGYVIQLEANASLTINDSKGTGVITGKTYVLHGAGGSKIILNAGKIYRSSWAVYTTGSFTINGGTVECKDGSMAIRVAGSGTITLNGGTVTSVQISGGTLNVQNDDATITSGIQLDKGAKDVNITAGTVNGKVTVAPEAQDKLTVSGGTFGNPDAVKDYLEDGLVIENGQVVAGMFKIEGTYYPTLAEAAAAAQAGQTIVLLNDTDEAYVLPAGVKLDKNGFNAPNIYEAVAKVGDVIYGSLEAAFEAAAATAEATITLIEDLTIESDLNNAGKGYFNVADGKKVTLDLGGKTITATDNSTGNFILFYSYGEFTIKNGTVVLTATNDRDWNAQSTIVLNRGGIFNCESGTYTHNGGTDMAILFDNSGNHYGDATTNIKGGELTSAYIAIRNRMEQNSHGASGKTTLNVTGGKINGTSRAVWAQAASTNETAPATGAINVSGGEVGLIDTPRSTGAVSMTTISGGTVAAFKGEAGELTVKGGTITGDVTILTAAGEATDYAITADGVYAQAVAKVGEVKYTDIQEAIKAAAPAGTVDVLADVTVDKWIMFAEKMTIGDGSLITLNINGLTINGNNKTMTVKSIESAGNGGYLFYDAQNLTVKDWTINIADGLVGGIGLQQGTISNVTFNGGQYGVLPGKNGVTVSGCTFNGTKGYAVYYEDERPGIVVTGNTFNTAEGKYAITMRSNEQFTDNTVVKGRVNLANSATSTVTGNDFGTERFKVYNDATATISNNKINNLVFNATNAPAASTFTADNTLSTEAQAAIEALPLMAGEGTEANPYTIASLAQLKAFRDDVNAGNNYQGKFIKLTAGIDLNNEEWTPIAYNGKTFKGSFDGGNNTIKNLKITKTLTKSAENNGIGLFGRTDAPATIKNLTIENVDITGSLYVGAAVGYGYTGKLVENVTVKGNIAIDAWWYAGVIGGNGYVNTINNCHVIGNDGSYIKGNDGSYIGGIWGFRGEGDNKITNCTVTNLDIQGVDRVGGISGIGHYGNSVKECAVNNVKVTATKPEATTVGLIVGACQGTEDEPTNFTDNTVQAVTVKIGDVVVENPGLYGTNIEGVVPTTNYAAKIGSAYYEKFAEAIADAQAGETVTLLADLTMSEILVLDKAITLDGNGKKLTSTAGRAINVDCEGNVAIKNLTINASGERAINVIQKPANVTIDNVTATAANYTVNLASSAGAAKVAISNSTLNGLCTVNVSAAGAGVTIEGSTVNCNDNNTTAGEAYAALCLNKEAVGGSIVATNSTINVTDGSDSMKGRNGAEGGTVTINGSTEGVAVMVAAITYEGSDYYYSFATLAAAVEYAKAGDVVTLIRDITASDIITINKAITLDGNGKKLTSTAGRAINVDCEGNVAIKNLTINASGERAINVIQKPANVTIENVTATAANYTVNLASSAGAAKVAISNSNLTGLNVVNVASAGAKVTIDGGTITCNDQTDAENYAALALNKDGKNATIAATGVTFDIKGDSKKAKNGAVGGVITIDGKTDEVDVIVAVITYEGSDYYYSFATLDAAIAKAKAGDVVTLIRDITASDIITIDKAITLDGNGKKLTSTAGRAINVDCEGNVAIKNLTINASGERAINVIQKPANVTIENVTATAANYTVNVAASAGAAKVAITGSNLTGLNVVNVTAPGAEVTINGGTITCNDQTDAEHYAALNLTKEAKDGKIDATGVTFDIKGDSKKASNGAEGGVITIDGSTDEVDVMVAAITYEGSDYYNSFATLEDAIEFAKVGETITLLSNVTVANKIVINKSIALDGNGKTITYTGSDRAIDVPAAADVKLDVTIKNLTVDCNASYCQRGINYNDDGKFTLDGVTVKGTNVTYALNLPGSSDNCEVTITDSKLTGNIALNVWGENSVINAENTVFTAVDNNAVEGYAAVKLNNDGTTSAEGTVINITGGKIDVTGSYAEDTEAASNGTSTGAINISETTVVNGKIATLVAVIRYAGGNSYGFETLKAAIAKAEAGDVVTLIRDIELADCDTIPAGKKITIDLNGKTITGTDNTSKNFSIIDNRGTLTIKDSSAEKTGKITLTATTNSGWNRYSAVIANNPGGKLTVEGGTLEHLGGTDMAYGIDNLTNGKGTYAETIINGGTIKSTYRAIRQFLNGTEAQNILTINGGTIEGANKSVFMHDPSKNANTGTLTIAEDAKLTGDVYLFVTAGSTEWPVEVSIAAAALQGESKVMTGNVPAGYDLAEVDGTYGVFSGIAKIGTTYYETIEAAIKAAKAGETITLLADIEATEVILLDKSVTINGNGHKVTSNATRVFRVTTANTEVTLNDVNMVSTAVRVGTNNVRGISIDIVDNVQLTLNNCSVDFTDASANDWAYAVNVTGGNNHVVTVNGGAYEGANVINVRGANNTVTVKDAVITCTYPNNAQYYGACIWVLQNQGSSVEATGNTFNGSNAIAFNLGTGTDLTESDNTDNTEYVVAMIGDAYYTSIQAAVEAAQNGETINLIHNVEMTTKDDMATCDGYPTFVLVEGKSVTIDLNGKNITANAYAEDLTGTMLLGVFSTDNGGKLTLADSKGTATVTLNANDAKVYSLLCNYEPGCQIKVEGGTYVADKVSDSMIYSGTDAGENEGVTVNGGNFTLGNLGQDPNPSNAANGKPWIFNTLGGNLRNVVVNGGTFNADVNHQFWANEVFVPETKALKANENGTWTVVPAVAYTEELATSTNAYSRKIGYATIEEAMAATNKYNCIENTVALVGDLEIENSIVVPSDVTVVLDLNGKVLSMNDASGKGAYAIKNQGNLTIADNSEAKTGKITFNSTTPDNSFGYATSTIGNAGQLTVNSGTIENTTVGGASYAIDGIWHTGDVSLTINGGTIVANKIAVRQVPFSATAKNVVTVKGGTLTGATAGLQLFNINNDAKLAEVNIHGGVFNGTYAFYTTFTSAAASDDVTINIDGGEFNGYLYLYNGNNGSHEYPMTVSVTGGTFNGGAYIYTKDENGAEVAIRSIAGGTFANNVDEYCAVGYISKANDDNTYNVVVNPEYGKIAQIGNGGLFENQYFATLNDAAQAAKTGDVIKLIADANISAAGYATVDETEKYATMMAVKEKDITLDMNGKTITVTPTADEVADAEMQMLMSVFGMDTNGKLTITGNGTVKVVANGTQVYSIVTAYGEGSLVTIENGNFEADKLMISGSLLYSQQSECIIVNGGNFKLGNLADPEGQNGQPWIFNTKGQNYTGAIVNGGTFPTDINHQFWAHEVRVPETKALKANEDGTWTVVDAVAYTTEKASSRGSYFRNIGYASIEDAIAATGKYNCQDNTVTMIKDITLEPITVAKGVEVAIDLNGKTISATDNSTAAYCLITNKGDLTINGTGAIQLTANNDRGWGARSAVISNEVGGKITVNGGTIQHLGGTAMAYAIDNLTNGKGTYAETIINGGEIKSTYRPIRMFLNGVEAQNILTVNAGTIESTGGNKAAIWMQDPSNKANTGTLYVGEDAVIKNNVYLDVTEGSTEWPVEAYIAKAALAEGMTVIAENVPADAAALVEYDEFWQVEQKNLAELTIEDACEEYINKIEKNVGTLTYERHFDDTEWQTLYLPFEVPVENLLADFEVAYIYNAGYKNNVATIDYVVIDENSAVTVLAANYPYLIRAKEEGWNNIVVNNAKLMPTVVNIIDCSSVFEKFVFAGNYSTLDASTLDAKKGYFDMNAGNWSRMDVLNPFRVYMQIEVRNGDGSDFVYPTDSQSIRMRSVDVNGNGTTGINGVDAEQNADYIFDLQGRRVLEPQKGGIYIVNGKKVIF